MLKDQRMKNWIKTLFFLSAFSPILITISLSRYWGRGFEIEDMYYIVAGVFGSSISLLILRGLEAWGEIIAFKAKKIESNDTLMVGVVTTYFVPILSKAIEITPKITVLIFLVLGIVFWFSSAIVPNPILRLFKLRFYKVDSEAGVGYTLITRRELFTPKDIRSVRKISGAMLLEVR